VPAQQIFLTTFDKIISVTTTYNIKEKVLAQKSNPEVCLFLVDLPKLNALCIR